MQGIPLIASPPVKHESPLNFQGYEVTKYQPPWKIFSDYGVQNDSDHCISTPAFRHLVNQVKFKCVFLKYFLKICVFFNSYMDTI